MERVDYTLFVKLKEEEKELMLIPEVELPDVMQVYQKEFNVV